MADTPTVQSCTTWASRNPFKDVQPTRTRTKKTLTGAEKVTRDARRKVLQANNQALQDDVTLFQEERDTKIQDLATKHSKTVDGVHLLLTNATHYKQSRAPSLQNALIHHKTEEVNAGMCIPNAPRGISNKPFPGRGPGDHLTLAAIQDLVANDTELQNLSKGRKQELKDDLLAARQVKAKGARASNLGAALDTKATMARVDVEVGDQFP